MMRALPLLLVSVCGCDAGMRGAPVSGGGLEFTLECARSSHRFFEAIEFVLRIHNSSDRPHEYVPVRWWDRDYPWHKSKFDKAEAALVVTAAGTPPAQAASAASG